MGNMRDRWGVWSKEMRECSSEYVVKRCMCARDVYMCICMYTCVYVCIQTYTHVYISCTHTILMEGCSL
jgi:hypothetical protein